ncbi:MAG: hypothetical protein JTT11_09450 [Candidatus Brockarchaeota archaeon]|nr:hypothetical protein [Candidatus Brockarchaeota archaeon]
MSTDEIEAGIRALERRKKELEDSFDSLERKRKSGEVSEDEYQSERKKIEREFVEVMDRLAQYRFQRSGFSG